MLHKSSFESIQTYSFSFYLIMSVTTFFIHVILAQSDPIYVVLIRRGYEPFLSELYFPTTFKYYRFTETYQNQLTNIHLIVIWEKLLFWRLQYSKVSQCTLYCKILFSKLNYFISKCWLVESIEDWSENLGI